MKKPNWIERTKMNIKGIIDTKKEDHAWKKENKNDSLLLKGLNSELKKFHVKLRSKQYENSPFSSTASDVMPIIFKYVDMCEQKYNTMSKYFKKFRLSAILHRNRLCNRNTRYKLRHQDNALRSAHNSYSYTIWAVAMQTCFTMDQNT